MDLTFAVRPWAMVGPRGARNYVESQQLFPPSPGKLKYLSFLSLCILRSFVYLDLLTADKQINKGVISATQFVCHGSDLTPTLYLCLKYDYPVWKVWVCGDLSCEDCVCIQSDVL